MTSAPSVGARPEKEIQVAPPKKTPAPATKTIVQEMTFEKSTKGTHVFSATEETAAVPTLYVKKTGLDGTPEALTLTLEVTG
jgi:hypothetical protein